MVYLHTSVSLSFDSIMTGTLRGNLLKFILKRITFVGLVSKPPSQVSED